MSCLIARSGRTSPAFADNWRIDGISAFPNAVTLLGLWPHMHVRGKDMKYVVTYPDGREETLLDVPQLRVRVAVLL